MFKRIKEFFNLGGELDMSGWFEQMEAESKASLPELKPCRVESCTFTNNSTIERLKLALKHCTKYEDRMFLQFLIKVEERNGK